MNPFTSHLLSRHLEPDKNLRPRIRGLFEPVNNAPGLFTGEDYHETSANGSVRQLVNSNTVQTASPQEEKPFHLNLPGQQTVPTGQSILLEKPSQGKEAGHHYPSPSYSSFEENRTKQRSEIEKEYKDHLPPSVVQPADIVPTFGRWMKETLPEEKNRRSQTPEDLFLKNNLENQTPNPFTGKDFADPNIAATHLDFSDETVQPVLKKRKTATHLEFSSETVQPVLKKNNSVFSETNHNNAAGLLLSQQSFNRFNTPPVQGLNEAGPPVIKVTIGRIDVRAVIQATSTPVKSTTAVKPKLSLEDYLKQRNDKSA